MKIGAKPENLIERAALLAGLAPTPLSDTHLSFVMARAIMVATKTGVFEALSTSALPVEDIIIHTQTDRDATLKLLHAMVHLGYLHKRRQLFSLTSMARKWMLKDSKTSLYDKMLMQFTEWKLVEYLDTYVQTGKAADMHQLFDEYEWATYQKGMRSVASTSALEIGDRTPVPKHATDMLDIGGSHGYYSVAICRKHPQLSSVILDLPEAIQYAFLILEKENMGDRVRHQPGNVLTADLGEETYDLIFMASLAHHFDETNNQQIVQKAYRALKPGGYFIIQDFNKKQEPVKGDHLGGLLDLFFATTSKSGAWPVECMERWMKAAGFGSCKRVKLYSIPGHIQLVGKKLV